jgi:hypothetical protein
MPTLVELTRAPELCGHMATGIRVVPGEAAAQVLSPTTQVLSPSGDGGGTT